MTTEQEARAREFAGSSKQRGFIHGPSGGELAGCFVVVAGFFIALGIVIAVFLPKAWAWFKPILLGWLA